MDMWLLVLLFVQLCFCSGYEGKDWQIRASFTSLTVLTPPGPEGSNNRAAHLRTGAKVWNITGLRRDLDKRLCVGVSFVRRMRLRVPVLTAGLGWTAFVFTWRGWKAGGVQCASGGRSSAQSSACDTNESPASEVYVYFCLLFFNALLGATYSLTNQTKVQQGTFTS